MALNTDTLMNDAICVDRCIPQGMRMAVLVSLAYQILISGSVGGASNNKSGNGSPVGVVDPDYVGQYYTNFDSPEGGIWVSTGLTNADWRAYLGV